MQSSVLVSVSRRVRLVAKHVVMSALERLFCCIDKSVLVRVIIVEARVSLLILLATVETLRLRVRIEMIVVIIRE